MNKTVSVTVAIKGINNLPLLKSCIKSLFTQSLKPKEIVVVGEKEDIFNVNLFPSKNRDIPIKKIYATVDKNEARNIGIMEARGEYVLYLDHDMVADKYLLGDCVNKTNGCEAIIIPEKGMGGGFWESCKRLERELIAYDLQTVTPRFYRKDLFNKNEKPFDSSFGLLDEWGFSNKLMKKNVRLGYSASFLLVSDANFSIRNDIINKFKRGLWMKNFYRKDKDDAWKRINPLKRGIVFYGSRLNYLIKEPKSFLGLIFLKTIDFISFMTGYFMGYFLNLEKSDNRADLVQHYDKLEGGYLRQMYTKNFWTSHVDVTEKEVVSSVWRLQDKQSENEKILDLGMGPGRWVRFFLDNHFDHVYGIDISPGMVKSAKKNISTDKFTGIVAEMSNLPFESGTFDKVFCFRALKYVDNVDDVFQEVRRVLKKDGSFMLEVSNNSLINRLLKLLACLVVIVSKHTSYSSRWGYFYKARFYSRNSITDMLLKQQFKIATVCPLFILPSVPLPTMAGRLTNLWKFLDNLLFTLLPKKWFCRSWIIIATK